MRGALLLLIAACGCGRAPASGEPDWEDVPRSQEPLGPRAEDRDILLEVGPFRLCDGKGPLGPAAGQQRISVPILVQAKSMRAVPVSPLTFSLQDQKGHRFRPTLAGCDRPFKPRELRAGEKLRGHVAFDVPRAHSQLTVSFEPFLIGRKAVSLRAKLPAKK